MSAPPLSDRNATSPTTGDEVEAALGDFEWGEVFTSRETPLLERIRAFAAQQAPPRRREFELVMAQGVRGLTHLVLAMRAYPSLRERGTLGRRERSGDTLIRKLMEAGSHAVEWSLPTKAVISRTFGIAKANFWTSMRYALQACEGAPDRDLEMATADAIEEAVYTRLAEELYGSFITSRATQPAVKQGAIEALVDLWEGRVGFATHRFCPLLRSAWVARCRAPRIFGTLMGTSEIVGLLFADCDEKFIQHLTQGDDDERIHAFQEFIFDLPYESLARVRSRMEEEGLTCVGPDQVARFLGLEGGTLRPLVNDPKALYSSFRTRRVKSQYRRSMGMPGPKRTAEAYVLLALLEEQLAADGAAQAPGSV